MNFLALFLSFAICGLGAFYSSAAVASFSCDATYCNCKGGDSCSEMRKGSACKSSLKCTYDEGSKETWCTCEKAKLSTGNPSQIKQAPSAGKSQ